MDFIANATSSIFAQGWTPELRAGGAPEDGRRQAGRCRAPQGRPGRVPAGTVSVVVMAAGRCLRLSKSTVTSTMTSDNRPVAPALSRRTFLTGCPPGDHYWLAVRPARAAHVRGLRAPASRVDHPVLVLQVERRRSCDLGRIEKLRDYLPGSQPARDDHTTRSGWSCGSASFRWASVSSSRA